MPAPVKPTPVCETCVFFRASIQVCIRFPPVVLQEPRADRTEPPSAGAPSVFPRVKVNWTCGEWKAP